MTIKGNKTKLNILKTAQVLFTQKGYKETSMQDICDVTGLSRGGLYRHFGNKDQVFTQILLSIVESQIHFVQESMDDDAPAEEVLDSLLEYYFKVLVGHENSLPLAIGEFFNTTDNSDLLNQVFSSLTKLWDDVILYGVKRGEFKVIEAQLIFDLVFYTSQGIGIYRKHSLSNEDASSIIIQHIKSLIIDNQVKEPLY